MAGEIRGLCGNCVHHVQCNYWRKDGEAVWYCEHFECESPTPPPAGNGSPPSPTQAAGDVQRETTFKGLCANCEHREDCCHPDKDIGVWHCEEYR